MIGTMMALDCCFQPTETFCLVWKEASAHHQQLAKEGEKSKSLTPHIMKTFEGPIR